MYTGFIAILFVILAVQEKVIAAKCPCDIYEEGGTPCVAAHSTVRALYSTYGGPLYQVRRTSDGTLLDIGVLSTGGFVNAAMLDTFLKNGKGTISKIYDQSPNGNHLGKAPVGGFLHNGGIEADAKAADRKVNGYQTYGVRTTSSWDNEGGAVGYRNNLTKGTAVDNEPEGMYMVCDGKVYNEWCCFDYGNAQTNNTADEPAIMETVYFGSSTQWGHGSGKGPWVMADLEWGLFAGGALVDNNNTTIDADYITGMIKGDSTNLYAIRVGNAQSGTLKTMYSGKRPNGYFPMKKEGAIVLGVGGDNSHTGMGIFFEGAMTRGYPSDATEDAIQANIVAAGYGSVTTLIRNNYPGFARNRQIAKFNYELSYNKAIFKYSSGNAGKARIEILDQKGRFIDAIETNITQVNGQQTIWNHNKIPSGLYLWRVFFNGKFSGAGRIAVGK